MLCAERGFSTVACAPLLPEVKVKLPATVQPLVFALFATICHFGTSDWRSVYNEHSHLQYDHIRTSCCLKKPNPIKQKSSHTL